LDISPRRGLAGLALLLGCAALPAAAHVTLDLAEAPAGSYVRLAIRVPHGCSGAATTGIRLLVPENLTSVRPAPKPGWTRAILPGEPAPGRGGDGAAAAAVREIAWQGGRLPDDQFDEFVLMVRTPDRPGESLWFPFVQDCEGDAVTRWTERAEPGQPAPRFPAHGLRLVPKP
jgi:uncharacterized protein YcnI